MAGFGMLERPRAFLSLADGSAGPMGHMSSVLDFLVEASLILFRTWSSFPFQGVIKMTSEKVILFHVLIIWLR